MGILQEGRYALLEIQKKVLEPLEQVFYVAVSHSIIPWVLGTEVWSSRKAVRDTGCWFFISVLLIYDLNIQNLIA